ncbi:hypothetical protein QQ045_002528 [Rhodiola kirilowii]
MLDGGRQEPGGLDPKPFDGVRFVLLGFDYDTQSEVRLKLVSGGGEDIGSYRPDFIHDDPTCVVARSDGKILVIGLWVDHSYDIGMPGDQTIALPTVPTTVPSIEEEEEEHLDLPDGKQILLSENYDGRVSQALDFGNKQQNKATENHSFAANLVQGSKFERMASERTPASDIGSSTKLEAVVEQVTELKNQQV